MNKKGTGINLNYVINYLLIALYHTIMAYITIFVLECTKVFIYMELVLSITAIISWASEIRTNVVIGH